MTIYLVVVYYRNGFPPDIDAFECRDDALAKLKVDEAKYGQLEGVSVVLQENTIMLSRRITNHPNQRGS